MLLAAEHRVSRACCGTPQLRARYAPDAHADACLLEDRLREVGPGAVACGGEMPDAVRAIEQLSRRASQMADVRRRGALVVDDGDLVALLREPQHRLHEVAPVLAEEAGRPHDPRALPGRAFAVQLRAAVRGQRARRIGLDIRFALFTVEDVIG